MTQPRSYKGWNIKKKTMSKNTIPVYIHGRSKLLYPLVKTLAFQEKTASANSTHKLYQILGIYFKKDKTNKNK